MKKLNYIVLRLQYRILSTPWIQKLFPKKYKKVTKQIIKFWKNKYPFH